MTRLLLFVVFMVLTAGAAYLLLQEDAAKRPSLSEELDDKLLNQMQFERIGLNQQRDGRVSLRLWSDTAVYYERSNFLHLEGVRFELLPAPRAGETPLPVHGTSQRGVVDQSAKRIVLTGKVEVRRGDALELRTERLDYLQDEELLLAPEAVWIRQQQSVQQGRDMRYSLSDEHLTLRQPMLFQ